MTLNHNQPTLLYEITPTNLTLMRWFVIMYEVNDFSRYRHGLDFDKDDDRAQK